MISQHRTTLVFVNTRRLAERMAMQLSERIGAEHVTSHHGSLSREKRFEAEERLKRGELQALVATASLELGIDIGSVDLVIQVGSTRSIATLLQRVGRAGHRLGAVPKGRVFPLSRDELIECAALLRATREGRLDRLIIPDKPLDILAQQIVAAAAGEEWNESDLYDRVRSAYPYRDLARTEFDDVVQMLAEGFTTRRGRRSAHIHYDGINKKLTGRRGARSAATRPTRSSRSNRGKCAWPTRRANRPRCRSGSVKRPAARTSCRRRSPGCGRTWRTAWTIRRPRSNGSSQRSASPNLVLGRSSNTSGPLARSWARFRPSNAWCWSASSVRPAACSSCCTRPSAAASTAPGDWRCGNGSAAASISSFKPQPPKTRSSCHWDRSTVSRSRTSSSISSLRSQSTSWCKRCSTPRYSGPAGAGTRPARSQCCGSAAAERCRRRCSAWRRRI